MFFLCMHGFSRGTLASSHHPKSCISDINLITFTLLVNWLYIDPKSECEHAWWRPVEGEPRLLPNDS